MSTRAKVYARDARGAVIVSQYHHHDGYEWNALASIVSAFLAAGEQADAVAVLSALLPVWRGEWSTNHDPQIGAGTTDLDYEYLFTVKGPGRPVLEIVARGDYVADFDGDGFTARELPPVAVTLDGMEAITARMVSAIKEAAANNTNAAPVIVEAYRDEVAHLEDLAAHAVETANAWQVMGALSQMAAA